MVGIIALAFALCFGAGLKAGAYLESTQPLDREVDLVEHSDATTFTNPLLACGDIKSLSVGAMDALKSQIQTIIDNRTAAGQVSHVSVYVRDLRNGPWLGINEKESFYPASLLKVPLLLAAYKVEEAKPGFLDSQATYDGPIVGTPQLFPPKVPLEKGTRYTIRELLRRSIAYSDNDATALIALAVGPAPALEVFTDFSIKKPEPGADYQMLVRTYASFFRVLYNASYLSRAHSEDALKILSQSEFADGLAAGVPEGTPIAHKFGEREGEGVGDDIQLHDCGIVYTENPYLICVMARGKNATGISATIAAISKAAYKGMGR